MGCQDRVVTAGLEALLNNVAQPFPKVRAVLDGYSIMQPAQRKERIEEALQLLDTDPRIKPTKVVAAKFAPTQTKTFTPDTAVTALSLPHGGAKKLATLGIRDMRDLLHYYPRRYEDRRALPGFHLIEDGARVTIVATVTDHTRHQPRKGMLILKANMRDDKGNTASATWFNQPWVEKNLKPGTRLIVTGKAKRLGRKLEVGVEYFENDSEDGASFSTDRIIGVYPTTDGVSQAFIRKCVVLATEALPEPIDFLSNTIRNKNSLLPYGQALQQAHFPSELEDLELALARLKFDEYLFLELRVMLQGEAHLLGKTFRALDSDIKTFAGALPFKLTNAQTRVIGEVATDMRQDKQMARLIQGDVGSGKTAVAACALYLAAKDGMQGALMAPTEILARQHFASLGKYLNPLGLKLELLLGAMTGKERDAAREKISSGEVDVVVGTQALIQEGVEFKNLGLAVVDEEHRFGVMQRRALLANRPDVLVMSATPIPRSLALTAYGDLELSSIDELPPGRTPIHTKLLLDTHRTDAYSFAMKQIKEGQQVYVVAPLIEESEKMTEILAATQLAKDLRDILPEARVDLLHGQMKSSEKEDIMARFRNHEFDLLVSTTVIEVGVDVPNATVMVIENAERFGLSQLHQLRGRVGRSDIQSYCILIAGEHSKKTRERLKVIEKNTDGFKIAEEDLRLRGPGELRGTRQSGIQDLRLGDISKDTIIIEAARNLAKEILITDPKLVQPNNANLRAELQARSEQVAVRDVV